MVAHRVPFIGNMLDFGLNPLRFLKDNLKQVCGGALF